VHRPGLGHKLGLGHTGEQHRQQPQGQTEQQSTEKKKIY
jgi:hypothetical protein